MARPNHLQPSELGTKEYWDSLYTTEITNHASNPNDKGTVWFDDSGAEDKITQFLDDLSSPSSPPSSSSATLHEPHLDKLSTSFLDLGCGNGSLLFALREEGWRGQMLGVDYSEQSIALARQIAKTADNDKHDHHDGVIDFRIWDVLAGSYDYVRPPSGSSGWDVILDKGTFDAISLSDQQRANGGRIVEGFKDRILPLLRPGGIFLITSCNWTEAELKAWFEGRSEQQSVEGETGIDHGRFEQVGRIKYPKFSFGGVEGQTITSLCFAKRLN